MTWWRIQSKILKLIFLSHITNPYFQELVFREVNFYISNMSGSKEWRDAIEANLSTITQHIQKLPATEELDAKLNQLLQQIPSTSNANTNFQEKVEQLSQLLENSSDRVNLDEVNNRLDDLSETLQEALRPSSQLRSTQGTANLRPDSFTGKNDEDPRLFMLRLRRYGSLNKWDQNDFQNAFPLFLKDNALLWYNRITDEETLKVFGKLEDTFISHFQSVTPTWVQEQELSDRKQKPKESVDSYINDIRRRCDRLDKSPDDQLACFIRGLLPTIKAFVITQNPSTLNEAEQQARLSESLHGLQQPQAVTDSTPTFNSQLAELTQTLKDSLALQN